MSLTQDPAEPITVACIYRVRPGREAAFEDLLRQHWPTLEAEGLVTGPPSLHWRLKERGGEPVYVEVFTWASAELSAQAPGRPAVMQVWQPMGASCEDRHGRPAMEFLHGDALSLLGA